MMGHTEDKKGGKLIFTESLGWGTGFREEEILGFKHKGL